MKKATIILLSILFFTLLLSSLYYSPEYMYRVIRYGDSDVDDIYVFPARTIAKSEKPYFYETEEDIDLAKQVISYSYKNSLFEKELDHLLEETDTTAFIIIKDDKIIYENYFNDFQRDTLNTSFSTAKSIVSLLIGIAIDQGLIESENEPFTNYVTELKGTEFDNITIEDLLLMRSDIKYREGRLWLGDDATTYYFNDLRDLAVNRIKWKPRQRNTQFVYNNFHPLLLGIVLERSTGETVANFAETYLFQKLGTEFDASWSLDSEKTGFEKMESGVNARAIDFAKIGSLVLHNGAWNNERIVSEEWLKKSTSASFPLDHLDYEGSFIAGRNTAYGYMWYIEENGNVFALGKYNQLIYISPAHNIVIVRNGKTSGEVDWWPDILSEIIKKATR